MKYYSTNRTCQDVNFQTALRVGIAPDYGLYMPAAIPSFAPPSIANFAKGSYDETAGHILSKFITEASFQDIKHIAEKIYTFPVPIKQVDDLLNLLFLDKGPTCSFKDFGAAMMARLMQRFFDESTRILVATSGDTGSAVAAAFQGMEIPVYVLFPEEEVTSFQRKQMTTLGKNIFPVGVKGNFDLCQAMVKRAFADLPGLSSANSINIGRLLPQIVYYWYAYAKTAAYPEEVVFAVPCGNFGNLMAGLLARKMGLPCRFVAGVNENDVFPVFLKTGSFKPISPSRKCLSNAMNVGNPNNLARIVDLYGGSMDEKGIVRELPDLKKMNQDIMSFSINDDLTLKTMRHIHSKYRLLIDPHCAVAWAALLQAEIPETKKVIIETADPHKFMEVIRLAGLESEMPEKMRSILNRKEGIVQNVASYNDLKKLLLHGS